VVGQLLLESLCSALPGAVLGLVAAVFGAGAFRGAAANLPPRQRNPVGLAHRLLRGLVSAQIALAIVLLVGAGLLLRTITLHISAGWGEKNDMRQVERRFVRTLDAMRAIPGVEDAALTIQLPGTGEDYLSEFSIVGRAPGPKTFVDLQSVSPEFFRVKLT
jgi:putative ABC transport system permease protein